MFPKCRRFAVTGQSPYVRVADREANADGVHACRSSPGHLRTKAIARSFLETRPSPFIHTMLLEPEVELAGVEPHEAPDLEEGNPALCHEPANMTGCNSERLGNAINVEQRSSQCSTRTIQYLRLVSHH